MADRGSFGLTGGLTSVPQSVLDAITAAQSAASAAQARAEAAMSQANTANSTATAATSTASTAQSSAQTAGIAATNLQAAVDSGNATHTDLYAKIAAQVAQIAAFKQSISTATAPTSLLGLGASVDMTFTLSRTMPNSTYQINVIPAPALLGAITYTIKSQTATTVVLTVKAAVAVTAGNQITILAWG